MFVILYGSLSDGIQGCVGGFPTEEAAEEYADSHNLGHFEKVVMELEDVAAYPRRSFQGDTIEIHTGDRPALPDHGELLDGGTAWIDDEDPD
jgi:hypothetical protein